MKNMKKTIPSLFLLAFSLTLTHSKAAEFNCEMIKEKQVRGLCIETRNAKEKSVAHEAVAQEKERLAFVEQKREIDKATDLAKTALKELKRLNVRVGTGVSYKDYPEVLSNAKFEVRQFSESPSAKILPDVATAMTLAIEHYDTAHELWSYKFDGSAPIVNIVSTEFKEQKKYVESLEATYNGISEPSYGNKRIWIEKGLSVIWKAASIEIKKAESLLEK